MREITSIADQIRGHCTFEFGDGTRICVSRQAVETYGAIGAIRMAAPEWKPDHTPLPVYQDGRMVGTLSQMWHHTLARTTMMYSPRATDFRREGDRWIADPMLGPSDLLHAGVNMIDKPDW